MTFVSRSLAASGDGARIRQITSPSSRSISRASSSMPRNPVAPVRRTVSLTERRAHRVKAPVDVQDLAGDRAGVIAQQEADGRRDRSRVARVPAQRRAAAPERRELVEAGNAAGGDRLDRARRDEVDTDPARAEVAREVARHALERRLRHPHPVIDRPGHAGVEVEPDDRTAALRGGQQRRQRGGERLQREGARLERGDRAARRRVEKAAAEGVRRRERDRVQHSVQRAPARAELRRDSAPGRRAG
jgi:hypothetical protein